LDGSPGKDSAGACAKSKRRWETSMPHSGRTGKTASLNAKINSSTKVYIGLKTENKEKKNENTK
jgi:hypothetical protein